MTTTMRWTSADLELLPDDGKRYEIIAGVLYEMPAPNLVHAKIIMNIIAIFLPLIEALGGHIYTAPVDVFMADADPVQPDIMVLLPDQLHLESKRGIEGPPALVVEVLSPSNPEHDRLVKRALYARGGVLEYWLISPEAGIIEILVLDGDRYRILARVGGDELIPSTVLPELHHPASAVFR
jgi:Uma2 family endonuclease